MPPFLALRCSIALPLTSLALVISGCSSQGDARDGPLGEAEEASVCATGATVKGIDVSVFQGTVDWASVKAAGTDFAIARISDGTFLDTEFNANWSGIKSAGLVRGAYQFFEPSENPTTQANVVVSAVGKLGAGDLPVTADMEVTGGESAATIAANLQTWVAAVTAGTGKAPMIYTAEGYWDPDVDSTAFSNLPLWVANYDVTCPNLPIGWSNWQFWQNASTGTVSGISGAVDTDEYNGTLAALQSVAGASAAAFGAQYVSQSWPLATTTLTLTVNQALPATLTLKNIGTQSWDTDTRIGTTQPRDRTSVFAGADWLSPDRPAGVTGTVAPGQSFEFKFDFYAPDTPGTFDEFFGVVEDGTAWFSDPGQGGPPDTDIEAKIQVVQAEYHGTFVQQSYPLAPAVVKMLQGQVIDGYIELKNVGTSTWTSGVTKLAPTPRDKPSALAGSSWLSPTRVSTVAASVATGATAQFPLRITAPAPGIYKQTFSLVEEGITWFADAPKGGGPSDTSLEVDVEVTEPDGGIVETDAGGGQGGAGGSGLGFGGGAQGGAGGAGASVHTKGSCSCRAAGDDDGGTGSTGSAWLAVAGVAVVVARRRRR
jgi:lysozyme